MIWAPGTCPARLPTHLHLSQGIPEPACEFHPWVGLSLLTCHRHLEMEHRRVCSQVEELEEDRGWDTVSPRQGGQKHMDPKCPWK